MFYAVVMFRYILARSVHRMPVMASLHIHPLRKQQWQYDPE